MKNTFFPTTIVDGFFEEPDLVRKFALSLSYDRIEDRYPGKRTKSLHMINLPIFNAISRKVFNLFFSNIENYTWNCYLGFQIVDSRFGAGWIHKDDGPGSNGNIMSLIVYLNPEEKIDTGTSLFKMKNISKENLIDDNIERNLFENKTDDPVERKKREKKFIEVLKVQGLYNRALMFDSRFYHSAQNFFGEEDNHSRLTLIGFFNQVNCNNTFPIQRMNRNCLLNL